MLFQKIKKTYGNLYLGVHFYFSAHYKDKFVFYSSYKLGFMYNDIDYNTLSTFSAGLKVRSGRIKFMLESSIYNFWNGDTGIGLLMGFDFNL